MRHQHRHRARQLGCVCLVGCASRSIDLARRTVRVPDAVLAEGDTISLDGNDGRVLRGVVRVQVVRDETLARRLAALRGGE